MANKTIERRFVTSEVELRKAGGKTFIEGYAAVFDTRSQNLGGFVEVVMRSAFTKTVKEADVRALYNHDPNFVLGRSKAGTLDLSVDTRGLHYRVHSPETSFARDLAISLERGDVDQSSFAFFKIDDKWDLTEDEFPQRSLLEVGLVDVSPVTYPAYLEASSGIRTLAAVEGLAKRCGVEACTLEDVEAIRNAIRNGPAYVAPSEDTSETKATSDELARAEARIAAFQNEWWK